jgi:hypothetical protein
VTLVVVTWNPWIFMGLMVQCELMAGSAVVSTMITVMVTAEVAVADQGLIGDTDLTEPAVLLLLMMF